MHLRALRLCVFALAVSMLATPCVSSPVVFIDAVYGDDTTGFGSIDNPFRTISRAIAYWGPSNKFYIAPGVYDEALGETFPLEGEEFPVVARQVLET